MYPAVAWSRVVARWVANYSSPASCTPLDMAVSEIRDEVKTRLRYRCWSMRLHAVDEDEDEEEDEEDEEVKRRMRRMGC